MVGRITLPHYLSGKSPAAASIVSTVERPKAIARPGDQPTSGLGELVVSLNGISNVIETAPR
jgi:hypothetical protein